MVTGALLVFIPMTGEYIIPNILGGGKFEFVGNVIGETFSEAQNQPFGSALSIGLMVALSVFVVIYIRFARRRSSSVRRRAGGRVFFTAWAVAIYAFLYLPILVMVVFAFDRPSAAALADVGHVSNICSLPPDQLGNITVWNGFTTCWFSAGLHDPTFIPAIVTSLQIAAMASIIATALGLAAALALARMRPKFRVPFDILVYLTLVVPEIVIAVASLIFFVQARNYFHSFPAGQVDDPVRPDRVQRLAGDADHPRAFRRHGRHAGGGGLRPGLGPLATFRQVTLPRLMPAIVAAALLCFTFSFDDYVLPAFTNGTTNTWPIVLYSAVRFGITPAVNALATIMLGVTVLAIVVVAVMLRRSRVRSGPRQEETRSLSAAIGVG